ncbi:hypothetical protein PPERSA_08302 [Pseudocohnilembus persalinus]|uniref:Uncharacterized protein n=1 Tax=Pseudocohnilembus persalinus TaxID=266149 RepID=A0A0V0QPT5_PSEPJ|nr:hypothetical protein PPERSA_08302 [Pseudocohnilembus persalinus]|eukprot:KRX04087.1 hypothetical protein PPERSA_08302 [Pseudocohnilembus persalinus]
MSKIIQIAIQANEELKDQEKQQAKQDYYKEFQESLKKMESEKNSQQQYTKESEVKNNFNQNQNQHEQKQKQQQEEEENNLPEDENLSMAEKLRRKFMNPTPQKTELNNENEQDTTATYQNAKIQSQTTSQVPFMITRSMKVSLLEIGYTPDQIRSMRPADAHYALLEHASEKNNQKK